MAYFHCLIGGGSSGGGYELTVTCDADFAGTTITATDGVTTLTQTCPSASPYEVTFEIPNGGDWTISGVVSGQTISTGVNIPTTATLEAIVQKTITIYSATEDTITYTDIYGDTQTEVFASGENSKQITVDINPNGSSITFTSGVAKDPNNLSNYYSKTVTITSNTTDVYLMPDNVLYWYGYEDGIESCITANGWSQTNWNLRAGTFNTNSIRLSGASGYYCAVGANNTINLTKSKCIVNGSRSASSGSEYGVMSISTSKSNPWSTSRVSSISLNSNLNNMAYYEISHSGDNVYISCATYSNGILDVYALWYE